MKEQVNEVQTKSKQTCAQRKMKAADVTELLSRALELRLASKKNSQATEQCGV